MNEIKFLRYEPGRPDVGRSIEWLQKNKSSYIGLWVAIDDGRLIASAKSRKELKILLSDYDYSKLLITEIFE